MANCPPATHPRRDTSATTCDAPREDHHPSSRCSEGIDASLLAADPPILGVAAHMSHSDSLPNRLRRPAEPPQDHGERSWCQPTPLQISAASTRCCGTSGIRGEIHGDCLLLTRVSALPCPTRATRKTCPLDAELSGSRVSPRPRPCPPRAVPTLEVPVSHQTIRLVPA